MPVLDVVDHHFNLAVKEVDQTGTGEVQGDPLGRDIGGVVEHLEVDLVGHVRNQSLLSIFRIVKGALSGEFHLESAIIY